MLMALKSFLDGSKNNIDPLEEYKKTSKNIYLEMLIDEYSQDIFYFIASQSNHALAQDICQKTWLIVVENKYSYQADQSTKAWLFKIARNLLIDEYRKQKRFVELDEKTQLCQLNVQPSDNLDLPLAHAINKLPLLQREALSLQLDGFSLQEIAMITFSNSETIKTRLRYARAQLKQLLGAENEK
jgi:RNA polymerase sigma factor (sigma-70 family)